MRAAMAAGSQDAHLERSFVLHGRSCLGETLALRHRCLEHGPLQHPWFSSSPGAPNTGCWGECSRVSECLRGPLSDYPAGAALTAERTCHRPSMASSSCAARAQPEFASMTTQSRQLG
mmetsp:Transcript_16569/g.38282  ORF Transcript_16569/g.38282 Transcript_16569/m.38282 type:complete len:118 (+) Transcript_16569:31-384(+)